MPTLCVSNKGHLCSKHCNQSTTSSKDCWVLSTTTSMSNFFKQLLQMLRKLWRMEKAVSTCCYSLCNPLLHCIWINALKLIFTKLCFMAKAMKFLLNENWMLILRSCLIEFIAVTIIKRVNEIKKDKFWKLNYMIQSKHVNIFKTNSI